MRISPKHPQRLLKAVSVYNGNSENWFFGSISDTFELSWAFLFYFHQNSKISGEYTVVYKWQLTVYKWRLKNGFAHLFAQTTYTNRKLWFHTSRQATICDCCRKCRSSKLKTVRLEHQKKHAVSWARREFDQLWMQISPKNPQKYLQSRAKIRPHSAEIFRKKNGSPRHANFPP